MKQLKPPIIKTIEGAKDGKNVAVIVGVHGNEKGPQLLWDWLNELEIDSGTIKLIFANPSAADENERFLNINLNRRFGQGLNEFPEDENAREIESVLGQCSASLDLHMYNERMDRPFVICAKPSNRFAKALPAKYIINIPEDANGGGTDDYMAMNGKIGICYETGSVNRPTEYLESTKEGVQTFLSMNDMLEHPVDINDDIKTLVKVSTKMVEHDDLKFTADFASFDELKKGQVICTEGGKDIIAGSDGYILFPRPNNLVGTEAFYTLVEA